MVRSLLLTFAMLLLGAVVALAQSTVLTGNISDGKDALIGATVKVSRGTDFVRGSITDYNGDYRIQLDPGTYDVEFSYTGFQAQRITGVRVLGGQITTQNVTMSNSTVLEEIEIVGYKVPLIQQDQTSSGQTLTSDQIKNLPTRSVNTIVATTVGASSIDGGDVNIKGSRSNGTDYYIDGIRVTGGVPPVQDLEQLQVITSGLGAEIGDVTGGIVSGTTKGPAGEYHGGIDVENSKGLDAFGYLLATANVSGPIIKKKLADGKSRTVLGFRISGQYQTREEDDPPALPVYRVKESKLRELEAHPMRRLGPNFISSASDLTNEDVDILDARPFQAASNLDLNGKIDLRLSTNIDLSLTGTFTDSRDQVDGGPNNGVNNGSDATWSLLNAQNNPTEFNNTYRGNFRFRHRLGSAEPSSVSNSKRVSISNANYTLQFAYERTLFKTYDPRHKDRLFDYGYIGKFETEQVPIAEPNDNAVWENVGYNDFFVKYTPGTQNPVLEAYNEFAIKDEEDIRSTQFPADLTYLARNGQFSTVFDDVWDGMYSNIGMTSNRFEKREDDIATLNATVSFDLKLGKSGTHNIQFGLLNEQRTNRVYRVSPNALYLLGSQLANIHFNGLDKTDTIGYKFFDPPGIDVPLHPYATVDLPENRFYREVRNSLGVPLNEWVNVNGLDPSQLSLSMFAPRELMDGNLVNYYGYDYLGNKTGDGITFNDFFTSRGEDNVRNFPNAPLRPLYQAAWLKDKFTFNKMIFSLGLRVERFDLNTKVLQDPYSLYKVMDAKTFFATVPTGEQRPNSVGDDFKVYTVSEQDVTVTAYRDGNAWYFPDGRQANDGNVIFGGGVVNPYLLNPNDDVTKPEFDPNGSFDDYTPQVNWLPRLAFSFPISEKANFFAHYDIMVQRPPSNWEATPRGYFYFYRPGTKNNANLRPERVVDYEVGFQQELNKRSAIKFSAYYREFRDMIQRRSVLYVPTIGNYDTYGNEDFGTVKGFTWQYDLRRTKNTELRIAYTLQFADGTGSDAESQSNLTTRGNIRYLFPLNFDERHNLATTIDYRFDSGKAYTGPIVNGKKILANFGVNMLINAASGRPYTAKLRPTRYDAIGTVGSVNGSRLPWRFNVDLRVDKTFRLNPKAKKPLDLNVYLRVANVLDRLNVVRVYRFTGSPTDDGFLSSADGISEIREVEMNGLDRQAYIDSYSWQVRNPNNFAQPRRIFVGASFIF